MSDVEAAVDMLDWLAALPAGPQLGVALDELDATRLHRCQLVELVASRSRQISHQNARLLVEVRELVYAKRSVLAGEPVRDMTQNPFGGCELAVALGCTDYAADMLIGVAMFTVDKAPALLVAMSEGRLDLAKAKIFATELARAAEGPARQVVDALLPEVEQFTTAQLRDHIRRLIATLDPDAIRKRTRKAIHARRVRRSDNSNGTASLAGIHLSKDRAAAAFEHIDAIAKATKAAGLAPEASLDELRADVFADLLAGAAPGSAGTAAPAQSKDVVNLGVDLSTLACPYAARSVARVATDSNDIEASALDELIQGRHSAPASNVSRRVCPWSTDNSPLWTDWERTLRWGRLSLDNPSGSGAMGVASRVIDDRAEGNDGRR